MNIPPLEKLDCSRGAPMGRPNIRPASPQADLKFSLARLSFVDGDYDRGGAYWGSPANIYRAVTRNKHCWLSNWDKSVQTDARAIEFFVRAGSRREAKQKVIEECPHARFYR